MADEVTFRIDGLSELQETLRQLTPTLERKYLRKALRQGANIIRDEARDRAPRRHDGKPKQVKTRTGSGPVRYPGNLKRGIVVNFARPEPGRLTARVTLTAAAFYGRFIEMGTALIEAIPFLRPALYGKAEDAVIRMGQELRVDLEDWVRDAKR